MYKVLYVSIVILLLVGSKSCLEANSYTKVQENNHKSMGKSMGKKINIRALGMGVAPQHAFSKAHAKVMARKSALIDAQNNLAEILVGYNITSETRAKIGVIKSQIIKINVEELLEVEMLRLTKEKKALDIVEDVDHLNNLIIR